MFPYDYEDPVSGGGGGGSGTPAGQYSITFSQLSIGLAGHNLMVLKDPTGQVVGELNGLAAGADGQVKPIGFLPSDTLKFYSDRSYYHTSQTQQVAENERRF